MTTTTSIPARPAAGTGRDPAVALWTVAGICWLATLALTLTGGAEAAHHDHVLEHDTLPWAIRILEFLAVWTVMLGAMMLPTLVPLARLFGPVSGRSPRPGTARAVRRCRRSGSAVRTRTSSSRRRRAGTRLRPRSIGRCNACHSPHAPVRCSRR